MAGPAERSTTDAPLGSRHPRVRELRALLRDRRSRDQAARFVIEGHRVLSSALDQSVALEECLVGPEASHAAMAVVERARASGVRVRALGPGVAARLGDTHTPQAVFGVAPLRRRGLEALAAHDLVLVADGVADPGNAGTLVRGAAAAGARVVALGSGSVDVYNPKVVRASAGALFAVGVVEGATSVEILELVGARGLRRLGAVASGGTPLDDVDLRDPVAIVLGHEARGLDPELPLDERITIPMAGSVESLNVAMAGTLLCFEVARQRRSRSRR
jgi:TrmH family RNA methyltransferase